VSVRVYGLFGFDRWPTFNVADASIVVTGILLMINILFFQKKTQVTDEEKEIPNE
jgi:signal peptidase II